MNLVARVVQEFLVFVTVLSVPFLVGRGIYRLIGVGFPDIHLDRSEDAAIGAGVAIAAMALLTYFIIRAVQFFRRRAGGAALSSKDGGMRPALGALVTLFFVGAMIDGFSQSLANGQFSKTQITADSIPTAPSMPDAPVVPDAAAIPDTPTAPVVSIVPESAMPAPPVASGADDLVHGVYSCQVGIAVLLFTIRGESSCTTSDIGVGPSRDAQCAYDRAKRTIQVNDPQSPLYYYEIKFIANGSLGSEPDRTGPGLEVRRAMLASPDGPPPKNQWCGLVRREE